MIKKKREEKKEKNLNILINAILRNIIIKKNLNIS